MIAFAAACVLVMSGCVAAVPARTGITEADIVGSWVASYDEHEIGLDIVGDGTLKFENLPIIDAGLQKDIDWDVVVDTTGTWDLDDKGPSSRAPWFRIVHLADPGDPSSGTSDQLFVDFSGDPPRLKMFWNGELDPPFVFERLTQ